MKKLREIKLLGLLTILTAALVFMGLNYLEGGKPPKWQWKVGIPNKLMAEEIECNLYGNPHGNQVPEIPGYITYEKNDSIELDFWTSEDKDTGETHSTFSLKIYNTEKGSSDNPGYYSIGFRNLQFTGCKSYCLLGGTGPCLCWVFPNYGLVGEDCCNVDCYGPGSTGYSVMKNFMETSAHPRNGYDHFSLRFIVYCDVEAIGLNESVTVDGYMWHLNVWNTGDTLLAGNEDYHNIVCAYWIQLEEVDVKRSAENEWEITVDQCGLNDPPGICFSKYGHSGKYVVFYEHYNQGVEKKKGRTGKTYIDSEERWALGAATPFKFITKWTRFN